MAQSSLDIRQLLLRIPELYLCKKHVISYVLLGKYLFAVLRCTNIRRLEKFEDEKDR